MMKKSLLIYIIFASSFLLSMGAGPANGMRAVFINKLANFEGIVPSLWSRVAIDEERTEVFILNPRERNIQIFNEHGMEIFVVDENVELSGATDIDVGENGEFYVVYPRGEQHKIMRLDYKGDPLAAMDLNNFPPDFQSFSPTFVQYMNGLLYMADISSMDVAVTDTEGQFKKGYHLKEEIWKKKEDFEGISGGEVFASPEKFELLDIFGFFVDHEENIFFTVPVLFTVFKLQADGELRSFGVAGGARGKFGVIAGITTDRQGNIYVTDRLKSAVLIFDSSFKYLTEFGSRGLGPSSLVVPDDVVINNRERLIYIAQAANRGVSIFRIIDN